MHLKELVYVCEHTIYKGVILSHQKQKGSGESCEEAEFSYVTEIYLVYIKIEVLQL